MAAFRTRTLCRAVISSHATAAVRSCPSLTALRSSSGTQPPGGGGVVAVATAVVLPTVAGFALAFWRVPGSLQETQPRRTAVSSPTLSNVLIEGSARSDSDRSAPAEVSDRSGHQATGAFLGHFVESRSWGVLSYAWFDRLEAEPNKAERQADNSWRIESWLLLRQFVSDAVCG